MLAARLGADRVAAEPVAADELIEYCSRLPLALAHVGDSHHAVGDTVAAREAWQRAAEILEDLRHSDAGPVRAKLASLTEASGPENP